MRKRQLKKNAKREMEIAAKRAARHRETEMAADLADTFDRLIETEFKLQRVRRSEREALVALSYARKQAEGKHRQAMEFRDLWQKARERARRNVVAFFGLGAAVGIIAGWLAAMAAYLIRF